MEIKRAKKTLAGLFLKYVTLFCANTILLVTVVFLLMLCAASAGLLTPANAAEQKLTEYAAEISRAGDFVGNWIPEGCTYGVYGVGGVWQAGNFTKQEQKNAWDQYEKGNMYVGYKTYFRFIEMEEGKLCIVKYRLVMRYANEMLNGLLPSPELMMPIIDVVLFILNAVVLSGRFAGKVKRELWELHAVTEKIAEHDLEFDTKASDIQEINEIMVSLWHMRDSLQASLKAQWDMEQQRQEQLSALAHDIKTPLTIIRGNTELMEEQELSEENRECAAYILANVSEIENYLESMRQVLRGSGQREAPLAWPCETLAGLFYEMAKQISAAEKLPAAFGSLPKEGTVCGRKADICRAWGNLISNAAEHTDRKKGIAVSVRTEYKEGQLYLRAAVRDYGTGFSAKDLEYAAREFYSGDASRHDRSHLGLGLSIAKKFAGEQGGFLEYGNCSDGAGAWAALWFKAGDNCYRN